MQLKKGISIEQIIDSPTLNTWLSYSTKALSLFIVLPLILREFSAEEITLWYLFATIISLQSLVDIGFKNTFIRFIAFAKGGSLKIGTYISAPDTDIEESASAHRLIGSIYSSMRVIYLFLVSVLFILLISAGSLSLKNPISKIADHSQGWIAWSIIVIVSCVRLYGNIYANFLDGLNKVALVRRWEALTSIMGIINSILFLIFYKSLLMLVIANQFWVVISVLRNKWLCSKVDENLFAKIPLSWSVDRGLLKEIWKPAWRSGLSGLMSNGLNDFVSILYAQVGNSQQVGSYLLAIRIITQIKEVSMAPFYSKIPYLAQLFSQGKKSELFKVAQRGMFLSSLIFVIGSIFTGVLMNHLLDIIGSKIEFVPKELWLLIVLAFFIHRIGAMHIQLYSTSNHIISHIADGVSGIIFIVVSFLLIKPLGLYAIPIAMLSGYAGFYLWYAAQHSYRFLNKTALEFEKKASLIPCCIFLIYLLFEVLMLFK